MNDEPDTLPAMTAPPGRTCRTPIRQSPLWLALLLVACSDPGSGGTGIPGPSAGAPPAPSPVEAPPPDAESPAALPPDCGAPPGAGSEPYTGQVRALADGCLLVDDRAIVISLAAVERRSGAAATASELVVGMRVTVVPEPADAGRARTVIIEDTVPN